MIKESREIMYALGRSILAPRFMSSRLVYVYQCFISPTVLTPNTSMLNNGSFQEDVHLNENFKENGLLQRTSFQ